MAIKIKFDSSYNVQTPTFVLATRYGKKIGIIPAYDIVFKDGLDTYSELSFKVNKKNNLIWDEIKDFKLLWCKEWNIWFELYVTIDDSNSLTKNITAISLGEAELSQIKLYDIEINTEDDISRDDYIPTTLYNSLNPSASLLNRILEKSPHYKITHVDLSIAPIQRTFSFDDKTIYEAFQEISKEINCLFIINSGSDSNGNIKRGIEVYDLESYCLKCGHRDEFVGSCPECGSTDITMGYGEDTNIFISIENLADEITYTTNTDSVKNCFKLEAGDDLMTATIANCNPNGSSYIWYISDELKSDMSDELVTTLSDYDTTYEYYQNDYRINLETNIVNQYNSLIKTYKPNENQITTIVGYPALMNLYYNTIDMYLYLSSGLMPNITIEDTTAEKQCKVLETKSAGLVVAVTDINKASSSTVSSSVLAMIKTMVDSRYQVKINTSTYGYNQTTGVWRGKFTITNYSDDSDTYTNSNYISITISDNYTTYVQQIIDKSLYKTEDGIDIISLFKLDDGAFKSELKKYCLSRLNSFHDSCQSVLDVLIEQGVANKSLWINKTENLYNDLYLQYYNKLGYIENEIKTRENEISVISGLYDDNNILIKKGIQNLIEEYKIKIQNALNFEKYLGEDLWLEFISYRREDTFTNDNYISDGLDNAELFLNALQFIEVAKKEIYKSANLQHSITAKLKNLLVMKEFKSIVDYFEVGNWIRIKINDALYRLRLLQYEIDFNDLANISITFSDVALVMNGYSDIQSILNQAVSMSTSYDSVSRQAAQGNKSSELLSNWVERGLEVTNTKIISSATEQSQTWDSHGMLFKKYNPLLDNFEDTQLKIINSTLAITNDNWKTVKTAIGGFYYYDTTISDFKYAYGVNAETIVGKLILGEQMRIVNANNSLSFTESGLSVKNNKYSFDVSLNNENLITISNSNEKLFYLDKYGVLHIKGDGAGIDLSNNNLSLTVSDLGINISNISNNLSKNYYTKSEINLKNDSIVASVEKKLEDYYTKSEINLKNDSIVANVEKKLGDYCTKSDLTLTSESIKTTVQDDYNRKFSSIEQRASTLETKIQDANIKAIVKMSATEVQYAWNNISESVRIENTGSSAQLNIYSNTYLKLMSLYSGGLNLYNTFGSIIMKLDRYGQTVYDDSGNKLMMLDMYGQEFYNKGVEIGSIGTSHYYNNVSYKALSFNLEHDAAYMCWGWKESTSAQNYTMKLSYISGNQAVDAMTKDQLHVFCDLNLHNYALVDWGFKGGSISDTFTGYIVTSFNDNGTAKTWKKVTLVFNKGILQDATW